MIQEFVQVKKIAFLHTHTFVLNHFQFHVDHVKNLAFHIVILIEI